MKPFVPIAALLWGFLISAGVAAQVPADAVWIDVRTSEEFAGGHLEGAHHIPYDGIETGILALDLEPDTPIYLYCRSGGRAGMAKDSLERKGYANVTNVGGLENARDLVK